MARIDDKVVFIDGALAGEEVRFRYTRRRGRFDEGIVDEVLQPSMERVEPECPHFSICGGCSLQHMAADTQVRIKQTRLLDNLVHIGGTEPASVLPPLTGPRWGYRRKARLGVKYVEKKGRLLIGFREKRSSFVADLSRCPVLHPAVGEKLPELNTLISSLSVQRRIPQVEIAVDDQTAVLVFRHLAPLSGEDRRKLAEFSSSHGFRVCLQSGGPDTVVPLLSHQECRLHYRLAEEDVDIHFRPTDFTQVNADINREMVARAIHHLDPGPTERVLDLFCGLGNFTLSLARHAGQVVGIEGDAGLIERARDNAARNRIDNVEFHGADLSRPDGSANWWRRGYAKLLLDPPRSGALEVITRLEAPYPSRIVYVSCNPATLARDAGELVRRHGYRLASAGVMDMFPHTGHVESMAVFKKKGSVLAL